MNDTVSQIKFSACCYYGPLTDFVKLCHLFPQIKSSYLYFTLFSYFCLNRDLENQNQQVFIEENLTFLKCTAYVFKFGKFWTSCLSIRNSFPTTTFFIQFKFNFNSMHLRSICNFDQIHFREIILIFIQCLQTSCICDKSVCFQPRLNKLLLTRLI